MGHTVMLLVSGATTTVGRLAPHYPEHLGHLLTPANGNSMEKIQSTGLRWACDNGAFSGLDVDAFTKMLDKIAGQPGCLFVCCPDVVGDAAKTLSLWNEWHERITQPRAFVLQDGQEDLPLPDAEAYFIGGTTRFKLSRAASDLAVEAKRRGAWLHMGRVNSRRRLLAAMEVGCDSVDGGKYTKWSNTWLPSELAWLRSQDRQPVLW